MKTVPAPAELTQQFISTLLLYKQKPYLPFWGAFFVITRDVKAYARRTRQSVHFYTALGASPVLYLFDKNCFLVQAEGLGIKLSQRAFIDSLLAGRFWPAGL